LVIAIAREIIAALSGTLTVGSAAGVAGVCREGADRNGQVCRGDQQSHRNQIGVSGAAHCTLATSREFKLLAIIL
jgi:hypothetical protein